MSDLGGVEILAWLFGIVIGLALLFLLITYVLLPLLAITLGLGAIVGGWTSIYNYGCAFSANVKPRSNNIP